jgi:abequosyltransferase
VLANTQLAITIPTHNRADFLDYSLEVHIPIMQAHNVAIYISDNASTDNTKEVIEKWQKIYPYLYYHCNEENIGPDKNFEIALKLPKTNYVWLLGDTYKISDSGLSYFLGVLNTDVYYDALVLNLADKMHCPTKDYSDENDLLKDLSGVMSCLSCLIYSKRLIDCENFTRYYNTYFMQTGVIFEYLANKKFLVHWVQKESVRGLQNNLIHKKGWYHTDIVFFIAGETWINFIFSLPPIYTLTSKLHAAKNFGKASGLFTYRGLTILRAKNLLNIKTLKTNWYYFSLSVYLPQLLYTLLIVLFPVLLLRLLLDPLKWLKNTKKGLLNHKSKVRG